MFLRKIDENGRGHVDMNWHTGMKVRYEYDSSNPYVKSTTPELVDVKITNQCPYKCHFCYQSSVPDGLHADIRLIFDTIDMLSELEVFEIAIGGGEPTEHPDFTRILNHCVENSVKPNFTCFGHKWLQDSDIVSAVKRCVGGIGVSVHDDKHFNKYDKIKKTVPDQIVMAQHVFGLLPFDKTLELVRNVEHILFLGYKETGFAVNSKQPFNFTIDQIVQLFEESTSLSVDTAFVSKYGDVLSGHLNVQPEYMVAREGGFSSYIDLVDQKMGPSSYDPELMTPLILDKEDFKNAYARY